MNTPPLRPVTTAPLARPGSELNTARARPASASISAREDGEPISSSEVKSATRGTDAAEALEGSQHERVHDQAGLHVGDAWAVGAAVVDTERAAPRLTGRKYRVAMAHQQDRTVDARTAEGRANGIAKFLVRDAVVRDAVIIEKAPHMHAGRVDAGLVVGIAVGVHQRFEQRQHGGALARKPVEHRTLFTRHSPMVSITALASGFAGSASPNTISK